MMVTVFRSRVRPENVDKNFTADDGERVAIVEFESEFSIHVCTALRSGSFKLNGSS